MQQAASDGLREKGQRKGRKESEFITVNANERVAVYNSLSLSAVMPESRSGECACVQLIYVTAMLIQLATLQRRR